MAGKRVGKKVLMDKNSVETMVAQMAVTMDVLMAAVKAVKSVSLRVVTWVVAWAYDLGEL